MVGEQTNFETRPSTGSHEELELPFSREAYMELRFPIETLKLIRPFFMNFARRFVHCLWNIKWQTAICWHFYTVTMSLQKTNFSSSSLTAWRLWQSHANLTCFVAMIFGATSGKRPRVNCCLWSILTCQSLPWIIVASSHSIRNFFRSPSLLPSSIPRWNMWAWPSTLESWLNIVSISRLMVITCQNRHTQWLVNLLWRLSLKCRHVIFLWLGTCERGVHFAHVVYRMWVPTELLSVVRALLLPVAACIVSAINCPELFLLLIGIVLIFGIWMMGDKLKLLLTVISDFSFYCLKSGSSWLAITAWQLSKSSTLFFILTFLETTLLLKQHFEIYLLHLCIYRSINYTVLYPQYSIVHTDIYTSKTNPSHRVMLILELCRVM